MRRFSQTLALNGSSIWRESQRRNCGCKCCFSITIQQYCSINVQSCVLFWQMAKSVWRLIQLKPDLPGYINKCGKTEFTGLAGLWIETHKTSSAMHAPHTGCQAPHRRPDRVGVDVRHHCVLSITLWRPGRHQCWALQSKEVMVFLNSFPPSLLPSLSGSYYAAQAGF
jgi:hypothetical protein